MSASQRQAQKAAIFVPANGTRGYAPLKILGDMVTVKLSAKETGGAYSVMENVTQPNDGPPLHVHHREDEGFFVLEGDYIFEVGGQRMDAHSGDFVWVPRDLPHTFQNVSSKAGRLLLTVVPAGLEEFFVELAAVPGPDPAALAPIFAKYGLELLGPPIAAR
jgi:mannose-6-phosphate isomerase-like protein (cupin superfamily)